MTRRKRTPYRPVNHRIEDRGRTYRVCISPGGRVLLVGLKHNKGGETYLDIDGRRAKQLIRKVSEEIKCSAPSS